FIRELNNMGLNDARYETKRTIYNQNAIVLLSVSIVLIALAGGNLFPQTGVGEGLRNRKEFVRLEESKEVKILLKYASSDNFMKENLYGEFTFCYLHREAFSKFQKAITKLKERKPNWKFILYDCLRPRSIQYKLWKKVKGTLQEPYVANPYKGSIHNFGFALDLSVLDEFGKEIDMGTAFDDFTPLAEPTKEEKFFKEGKLTKIQIENRKILRSIMIQSGFIQRPNEWWHYDALPQSIVQKKFRIVE
ncbi:MAG: M15 family metallopeptidase, partial [Flavobacterium sp.]|nr:M15 family metallopeptidase [Flavobacterium sp.]